MAPKSPKKETTTAIATEVKALHKDNAALFELGRLTKIYPVK